ncbi:type II 3-dehydroquinate dehydratase [uncultured Chitinophaga sp.]|jgi:3-dehydroquinate dehydratase, type II|uniref:type II 3-dehydroquinate dehydratase n=1 Tax=uncultured Chitinophaga sp. TaxID=339340 RepID=UPI00261430F6|nr:type II 3-dehydroquinate dehydratase [uncultured Chitinophaga sp.]
MHIVIINGPNLNLLGKREPGIYGSESFEDYFAALQKQFPAVQFTYFQSNVEGEIINQLHEQGFSADGILLNAGGYTHTSVAIRDAIAAIKTPVIEIHISNVYAREEFRHTSLIAPKCAGSICGLGMKGYALGVQYFLGGNGSGVGLIGRDK